MGCRDSYWRITSIFYGEGGKTFRFEIKKKNEKMIIWNMFQVLNLVKILRSFLNFRRS